MADDLALAAERIVLGAMMLDAAVIDRVTAQLRGEDFADPRHQCVYAAVVANHAGRTGDAEPGAVAVARTLNSVGELGRVGGLAYLHTLISSVPTVANATWYATVVADAALARRAVADATRLAQVAEAGDAGQIVAEQVRLIEAWSTQNERGQGDDAVELDEFLDGDEPDYDWLVPGVLERGDRLKLTGPEGGGKSTLLRQMAVQIAAGIHPFTGEDIEPLCVLIVDLENSARQIRRAMRPLRLAAGRRYDPKPGLHVRVRPDGIDLLGETDGRWLLGLARSLRPDLIITGPTYKMASGDPTEERTARAVTAWLDRVRVAVGCALIIEAHSPHGTNGGKRPIRPYGASLWLRWPEFGLYLSAEGYLQHWRGPREEREWPAALQRGGEWPWTPVTRQRDLVWARIASLCQEAGDQLSYRDLAGMIGTSVSGVQRAVSEHPTEWARLASSQVTGGDTA